MWEKIDIFLDTFITEIENSIKCLFKFWKNNCIYFLCSLFYYFISALLLGGTFKSFSIVFAFYVVSLIIGFSNIGEKLLRILNKVRPMETKRETEYLQPLFDEVYASVKVKIKRLQKIEICIIDNMTVNAMAIGRRTIAITKGAMQTFSENELKAIIAHEIAHILHGDTIAVMYAVVGNGILSILVMFARLFLLLFDWLQSLFSGRYSIVSAVILLLRLMFEASIWIFNFGMQVILSVNSRQSEFSADNFRIISGMIQI